MKAIPSIRNRLIFETIVYRVLNSEQPIDEKSQSIIVYYFTSDLNKTLTFFFLSYQLHVVINHIDHLDYIESIPPELVFEFESKKKMISFITRHDKCNKCLPNIIYDQLIYIRNL